MPDEEPVILPVQVRLPVELATVQPVAAEPPAMLTSIAPSVWRFKPVAWALIFKPPAELVIEAVVVDVSNKVPEAPNPRLS